MDCGLQGSDRLYLTCCTPCMHLPRYRIRSRDDYLITQGDLPLNTHWTRQVQTHAFLCLGQKKGDADFLRRKMVSASILLLLSCCLATSAVPIPGYTGIQLWPSSSSNIGECQESLLSPPIFCSFYETCIEPIFPCGPLGLTLGYAKPRCDGFAAFQLSESGCQECIESLAILEWVLLSEKCFQSELLILAQSQESKPFPDPPDCVQFETDALDILQRCYLETDYICLVKGSVLESDLSVVLDAVVINSYYKSAVTKQFLEVVTRCSLPYSSTVAGHIAPQTERMFLCTSLSSQKGLTDEGLTEALAEYLDQSSADFVIASYDLQLSTMCRQTSKPSWSVGSADYFVVQWTLTTGADTSALTRCQSAGQCTVGGKYLVYFQFSDLTTSSCGNGLREAGESCDLFVYTGMSGYGCDTHCNTIVDHECTTERLQQSSCSSTVCGDGLRTSNEECDEGSQSFVGCNPESCTIQDGYQCVTPYNATSICTEIPSPPPTTPC